jgi:hypothetical protein
LNITELADSGKRTTYPSGGMRELLSDKGRCDLLPLRLIGEHYNDLIFVYIEEYIRTGKQKKLWLAIEMFAILNEWTYETMLLEVAKHYEAGAKKYADRNWELGIPLHSYIDSGVRHYLKWMNGDTDEPHDRAFVWNLLGAMWTQINKPEYIDLPFADKEPKENDDW